MNDVNKIISNFKKGVADALFRGKENNPNNLDYYRQGYDYGIFLYSEINEEEREAASSKPQAASALKKTQLKSRIKIERKRI